MTIREIRFSLVPKGVNILENLTMPHSKEDLVGLDLDLATD